MGADFQGLTVLIQRLLTERQVLADCAAELSVLAQLEARVPQLRQEVAALEARLHDTQVAVGNAETALAEARARQAQAEAEATAALARLDEIRADVRRAEDEHRATLTAMAAKERERQQQLRAETEARKADLLADVNALEASKAALEAELGRIAARATALSGKT